VKKVSCILLAMILIISAFVTAGAYAGNADLYTLSDAGPVSSMIEYDGKLIVTYDYMGYAVIDPAGNTLTAQHSLEDLAPADDGYFYFNPCLVQADEGIYLLLYGINEDDSEFSAYDYSVVLEKLDSNGGELTVAESWQIDWQPVFDAEGSFASQEIIWQPCIVNGLLIGNVYGFSGAGYIAAYNLESGEFTLTESDYDIAGLYRNGQLLSTKINNDTANPQYEFYTYDPAADTHTRLFSLSAHNFYGNCYCAYHADSDVFFYVVNGELYRMEGADIASARCLGPISTNSSYSACALALNSETYVCSSGSVLYRYTADGTAAAQTLNIANYTGYYEGSDAINQAFASTHPDIVISDVSIGSAARAIADGSTYADIYIVNVASDGFAGIMGTGLLPHLEISEVISAEVSGMYPWVQEYTTYEGHIVAVPVLMTAAAGFNYYPLAFEALGLTEDDVPETWLEFLQLMQRLPALIAENGTVAVFPSKYSHAEVRDMVFEKMMESYILYMQSTGQPLTFDTPLMHALIEEFEKIDFKALGMPDVGVYSPYGVTEVLFAMNDAVYVDAASYYDSDVDRPLMLAMEAGTDYLIPVDMNVAFVNPYSENPELAMEYMEAIAVNNPLSLRTALSPAYNQPIISATFEEDLAFYDEKIAEYENQLETASEDAIPEIKENLAYWQQKRDEFAIGLDPFAWDVSVESIAWYRSIDAHFLINVYCSLDNEALKMMYEQFGEYTSGSITADELITTLDMMVNMLVLEAE